MAMAPGLRTHAGSGTGRFLLYDGDWLRFPQDQDNGSEPEKTMGDKHKKKDIRSENENTHPDGRALSPAARRALREAEERRQARTEQPGDTAGEVGGRKGPEPARYGDWEKDGIASDF